MRNRWVSGNPCWNVCLLCSAGCGGPSVHPEDLGTCNHMSLPWKIKSAATWSSRVQCLNLSFLIEDDLPPTAEQRCRAYRLLPDSHCRSGPLCGQAESSSEEQVFVCYWAVFRTDCVALVFALMGVSPTLALKREPECCSVGRGSFSSGTCGPRL